jgi:nucleotide-binding universal stress UspA family protein
MVTSGDNMTNQPKASLAVVGVDGSSDSDAAIRWVQSYADATGGAVRLVVAWQWPQSYGYPMMFDGFDPEADARKVAEKAAAELSLPADRLHIVVREGSAGLVLVDASKDADLLVVGSRGHNAVSGALLGSVSHHCVHHATVSVVVVR